MNRVETRIRKAQGSSQKLQLFMRGSAMSGAPIISGIIQLARPTKAGITAPNTMISPCMVVIWLKNSGCTICRPGWNSSARMTMAMLPPSRNMAKLNIRYMDPMSLWFVVSQPAADAFGRAVVMFLAVGICNRTHENPRYRLLMWLVIVVIWR